MVNKTQGYPYFTFSSHYALSFIKIKSMVGNVLLLSISKDLGHDHRCSVSDMSRTLGVCLLTLPLEPDYYCTKTNSGVYSSHSDLGRLKS
jgi:hypothetical protein